MVIFAVKVQMHFDERKSEPQVVKLTENRRKSAAE